MIVSEILNSKYGTFPDHIIGCVETELVSDAIERMWENKVGALVVSNDDGVAGVFSERDVLRLLMTNQDDFRSLKLSDVMTRNVIGVSPNDTAEAALETMRENRIRHLTVMEGDKLVGFLSLRDLMVFKIEHAKRSAQFLKDQIAGQSDPLPM